jgi:hypothetical protein
MTLNDRHCRTGPTRKRERTFPSLARRGRVLVHKRRRRGTIYVVTLTTTLIVLALGTVALSTARIQRQQAAESNSLRQAQLHAESALQIARYRIRTDSSWRSKLSSNTWAADQPIGNGYYSFTGTDPGDGNLNNGDFDPVVITATGKESGATYYIAARYEFEQPGLTCLQSSIHSAGDLEFRGSVVATSSAAPFSANQAVKPQDSSQVYANCVAVGSVSIGGSAQVFGTITNGATQRTMPDTSSLLSYYQGLGTSILATALPLWDREYVVNPGAESGAVTPWVASNCTAAASTTEKHSGNYSFYISNRSILGDGVIKQDITSKVAQNVAYTVSGAVLDQNFLGLDNYRLHILVQTTTGNVSFTSGWYTPSYNNWLSMSFTPTLTWSGNLIKAEVFVQTSLGLLPYFVDSISVREVGAESSTYVMHRKLLSPQSNPFTGVLNSQGIYVLNCAGNKINLRDSRISGTLVILNPGSGSRIEGSICWDPTTLLSTNPNVPNLPALITDDQLQLGLSSAPLSEAVANLNLNPAGSSYAGTSDTDLVDSYPSQISGIVYSSDEFTVTNNTTVNGSIVGATKITVQGTAVTVNHQPLYYYVNPPVGFRAAPLVKMKSGSVEQIVQ